MPFWNPKRCPVGADADFCCHVFENTAFFQCFGDWVFRLKLHFRGARNVLPGGLSHNGNKDTWRSNRATESLTMFAECGHQFLTRNDHVQRIQKTGKHTKTPKNTQPPILLQRLTHGLHLLRYRRWWTVSCMPFPGTQGMQMVQAKPITHSPILLQTCLFENVVFVCMCICMYMYVSACQCLHPCQTWTWIVKRTWCKMIPIPTFRLFLWTR